MSTDLDAKSSGSIFRKDNPQILACNRHQATIIPVRLAYDAAGYFAGVVLARNSVSGYYQKYDDAAASGLNTAVCILFQDAEPASGSTELAQAIAGGKCNESLLTGLDAAAKVDLKSRSVISATGTTILMF